MKKIIWSVLLQFVWTTGFSQNPSSDSGTPFRCPNLDVQWDATISPPLTNAWVYRYQQTDFSPTVISNLMRFCSFTEKDKTSDTKEGMVFQARDGSRKLSISFALGAIDYEATSRNFGPTNLAQEVPKMSQLPELTTNFLRLVGIELFEIKHTNSAPEFNFWEPFTEYFVNRQFITNVEFRAVGFKRAVDGVEFVGYDRGGNGELRFGEHGRISQIHISWRKLERYKQYPVVTSDTIVKWIRSGKASQGPLPMDAGSINWRSVKTMTIKKADICYLGTRFARVGSSVKPFLALWTTVDTGSEKTDVEIDCPIITEAGL